MSALPAPSGLHEPEPADWPTSLRTIGPAGDDALARLHALLLRAARFEVARRAASVAAMSEGDLDEVARGAAADALASVYARLDEYRPGSSFTTWAAKFALLEAAIEMRRLAWESRRHERPENGSAVARLGVVAADDVGRRELLAAIRAAIDDALEPHQRRVLVALALDGTPIDVLADGLDSTRERVYETLQQARRALRAELARRGVAIPRTRPLEACG